MKKVFLVDDHPLILESLKHLLHQNSDFNVVGTSSSSDTVLTELTIKQPDILVLDVSMPEIDAFQLVPRLKEQFPHLKIVMYTMHALDRYYNYFKELGVDGYVLKSGEYGNLIEALTAVARGEQFLAYENTIEEIKEMEENQVQLSQIEKSIIDFLNKDFTNKEIAQYLDFNVHKIMEFRKKILLKTGCESTTELLKKYRNS